MKRYYKQEVPMVVPTARCTRSTPLAGLFLSLMLAACAGGDAPLGLATKVETLTRQRPSPPQQQRPRRQPKRKPAPSCACPAPAAGVNLTFFDPFDGSELSSAWTSIETSCHCIGGVVQVHDGLLQLGEGTHEAPGASQHKLLAGGEFSSDGGGIRASALVLLNGDYQGFGAGVINRFALERPGVYLAWNTLERASDGVRADFAHALVDAVGDDLISTPVLDVEVPVPWGEFVELSIEWQRDHADPRVSRAVFAVNGGEAAEAVVATGCHPEEVATFNMRPQEMLIDWFQVTPMTR